MFRPWYGIVFAGLVVLASAIVPNVRSSDSGGSLALPANPVIQAWMAEVDVDSLQAYVEQMVAFGTRHTASDTVDANTGIGAARRWVFDRFEQLENPSATASYFDYFRNICGTLVDAKNVLLLVDGTGSLDRRFVSIGHLDSRNIDNCDVVGASPGANDNASGTAIQLELARILADETFDTSVQFVASTGEEQGLFGATVLAGFAFAQGIRVDGVLNNDIVGNILGCEDPSCPSGMPDMVDSMSVRLFSPPPETSNNRQLSRAQVLQQLRYMPDHSITLVPLADRPGRGGDHLSYADRGFAATRFTEAFEFGVGDGSVGHQHNNTDLVEFMNFPYLARNAQLTLACLANFALAPETPNAPSVTVVDEGELDLMWPSVTTAPDLAGYRVAVRISGELFYTDVVDAGLDVGAMQTESLTGLPIGQDLYVSVSAYDADFNESIFSDEVLVPTTVSVTDAESPTPAGIREVTAPGARLSTFVLSLPSVGSVTADVFDVSGRRVHRLFDGVVGAGERTLRWDGTGLDGRTVRGGVYFVNVEINGREALSLKTVRVD